MASSLNKYLLERVIQHITSLVQDINIVTKHMKPKFVSDTLGFGVGDIILVEGIVPLCYVISEDKNDHRITSVYPLNRYTADKILKKEFSKNIENEIKENQTNIKTITIGIDKTQSIMTKGYREAITDTDYMAKDIWHPLMSPIEKLRSHAFKPSSNDIDIKNESWRNAEFGQIYKLISEGDFYGALKHIINIANTIKAELHLQSSGTAIKDVTEPIGEQYPYYSAVIQKIYNNPLSLLLKNSIDDEYVKSSLDIFSDKSASDGEIIFNVKTGVGLTQINTKKFILQHLISFLNTFSHGNAIHSHDPNIHICDSIVFWLSQPILYNTQPDIFSDLRDVLIALAQRYLKIKKERDEEFAFSNANTLLLEEEAAASKQLPKAVSKVLSKEAASKPPHKITASEPPPDAAASKQKRKLTIYGVKYFSGSEYADFNELIKTEYNNTLYIYNENFDAFTQKEFIDDGAGNGFLRKYRQDDPDKLYVKESVKSLGFPTGKNGLDTNIPSQNKTTYKDLVLQSTEFIIKYIDKHPDIKTIYYSIHDSENKPKNDDNMNIGLSVFFKNKFTQEIAIYINETLFNMFKKLSNKYDVTLYRRSINEGKKLDVPISVKNLYYHDYEFVPNLKTKQ
jgi:hypothetical protein